MRFGKIQDFALEIDPVVPTWERRTPSDQGPWARLSIWAEGDNLCRHWTPGASVLDEGVYVPLAPIADWLCRNLLAIAYEESAHVFATDVDLQAALERWRDAAPAEGYDEELWDDLRWEWSERHFLAAGADGAFLPNLAFVRADDDLWLSVGPARFATPDAPVFLVKEGVFRASWIEAIDAVGTFVGEVAGALRESNLVASYPWCQEADPVGRALKPDLSSFARLALGLEAEQLTSLFAVSSEGELWKKLKLTSGESPGRSATLQALRDLEPEKDVARALLEDDLASRGEGSGVFAKTRALMVESKTGKTPEEQGHRAARSLRRHLGFDGRPLEEPEIWLGQDLGIGLATRQDVHSMRDHMTATGHVRGSGHVTLFDSPSTQTPWARRMEALRGVGHLLTDGTSRKQTIGAGSSTRAVGPRRRRSGAFAAEMVLPQEEIRRRAGGVLDRIAQPALFISLLDEYCVGARTAAWQSWNAGLLSERDRVDELIQTHGRTYGDQEAART